MIAGGTGITPMYQVGPPAAAQWPGCLGTLTWLADSPCLPPGPLILAAWLEHASISRVVQPPNASAATTTTTPPLPPTHLTRLPLPPSLPPSICPQVIKAVLKDTEDATQLRLLYTNVSPDDILLRDELDALAAAHPNFQVWYTGERGREE